MLCHGPVRVPDECGDGHAKLTVRFQDWKGRAVKPATVEVPVRTAPENDREILVLIPQGSAVKISKCSHGWCQVSWHGQTGYALAKNFLVAGLEHGTTHADFDADQSEQDSDGSAD